MSDALSFAEIDGQHVELLPARTVLSSYCGYRSCHWDYCDYYSNEQYAEAKADADAKQVILNFGDGVDIIADNDAEAEAGAINQA
ncbi:MAG: hypothetical protein ACT4NY_27445 [Pseudonocardiales bacterium]